MTTAATPDGTCANCSQQFRARRKWQRFCTDQCRNEFHARAPGDGALRGRVKSVRLMARGHVSVIIRFPSEEHAAAALLSPGIIVEVRR